MCLTCSSLKKNKTKTKARNLMHFITGKFFERTTDPEFQGLALHLKKKMGKWMYIFTFKLK